MKKCERITKPLYAEQWFPGVVIDGVVEIEIPCSGPHAYYTTTGVIIDPGDWVMFNENLTPAGIVRKDGFESLYRCVECDDDGRDSLDDEFEKIRRAAFRLKIENLNIVQAKDPLAPTDAEVEEIAILAHEVNRVYCESIGDNTQPPHVWMPDWQRESAMNGVRAIDANWNLTPEQQHEVWMKQKIAEGWVYDETKDAEKKAHLCLCAYNELPEEQRIKDTLFGCVVHAALRLKREEP